MTPLSFRQLFGLGFLACAFAMAFAAGYVQRVLGLEPCPLCVLQRVAMVGAGGLFLVGAILAPRGFAGRWGLAGLTALVAVAGIGVAGRHVWLQSLPADQVPACGPTLEYLMDMMPFAEVLATVLRGDGNCAVVDAQWLGISLPGWTLVAFVGLALLALAAPVLARRDVSRKEGAA